MHVPESASELREEAEVLGYVGFDIEYAQTANKQIEITCLQLSASQYQTFVFKFVGESLTIEDVLKNGDIRFILESEHIGTVGVGIQGTFLSLIQSFSSTYCF